MLTATAAYLFVLASREARAECSTFCIFEPPAFTAAFVIAGLATLAVSAWAVRLLIRSVRMRSLAQGQRGRLRQLGTVQSTRHRLRLVHDDGVHRDGAWVFIECCGLGKLGASRRPDSRCLGRALGASRVVAGPQRQRAQTRQAPGIRSATQTEKSPDQRTRSGMVGNSRAWLRVRTGALRTDRCARGGVGWNSTGTPEKTRGLCNPRESLARRTGLEPAASGVTGRRYNQL